MNKTIHLTLRGDFYEAYGSDAKLLASLLGFTLTSRPINGIRTPLCGIPFFSSPRYFDFLKTVNVEVKIIDWKL